MSRLSPDAISSFNAVIEDCQGLAFITRDLDLQRAAIDQLGKLLSALAALKAVAVSAGDEETSNALLGFECVASCIQAELEMWLLLKQAKPDEAWTYLIAAETCAVNAARAHPGFEHLTGQSHRLEEIEKLIFPPQVFLSSGWLVGRQECSICASEYGECDHLIGKPYMGRFCAAVGKDLSADHVAIVKDPNDKRCRVVNFANQEGKRNRMTWKLELPPNVESAAPNTLGDSPDYSPSLTCEGIISTTFR